MKHLPLMRIPEYDMERAARHLEDWIHDRLPLDEFVDVFASLVFPQHLVRSFWFSPAPQALEQHCLEVGGWAPNPFQSTTEAGSRFETCPAATLSAVLPACQPESLEQRANHIASLKLILKQWLKPYFFGGLL